MKCPICNGTGKAQHFHRGPAPGGGIHQSVSYGVCDACGGTGRITAPPKKRTSGDWIYIVIGIGLIIVGIKYEAWIIAVMGGICIWNGST